MNRSSLLRKVAAPLAGLVAASGLMIAGAPAASAAPLGTLTFNGLTAQDVAFSVTTSGPCPAEATNYQIKLEGGNIPSPSSSPNLTGNTAGSTIGGGINSGAFTANSAKTLLTFASGNGLSALGDGNYTVTLFCRTVGASASLGDYVGNFTISNNGATVSPPVTISPDATTTTLSPSTLSPSWGDPLTMAVTVANLDAPAIKAAGTIALKDGATVVATGTLTNGAVTIPVASLAPGAHSFTAVYTPSSTDLFQASTSSASIVTVGVPVPSLLRAATLTGSIKVGGAAVCNTGTWLNANSYTYEFLVNGAVVQTSASDFDLVLAPADAGKTVACRVTGVNPNGSGTASTTAAAKVALGDAAKATKAPRIVFSGSAANVGETLKAYKGVWSPTATYTYNYIWKRGTTVVKQGATATSYKATAKDKGKKLTLTVQVKRTGYTTAVKTSAAVTVK